MSINIEGIDRKKLLTEMWKNAPIASFFIFRGIPPPPLDPGELEDACNNEYIDYMCGRPIKTRFNSETNIISDREIRTIHTLRISSRITFILNIM